MGIAAAIGTTLFGGFLQGRSQQQQYNAAAKQQEVNAQIANQNADKVQQQAEELSQSNTINAENKRRQLTRQLSSQKANVGAAGIMSTGSAAEALADSQYNISNEMAIDAYNSRQNVENMFQQSTDLVNQRDIYNQNAKGYKKAGKRAFMNSMLMSGLSLAGNLYNSKSAGKQNTSNNIFQAGVGENASQQYKVGQYGFRY